MMEDTKKKLSLTKQVIDMGVDKFINLGQQAFHWFKVLIKQNSENFSRTMGVDDSEQGELLVSLLLNTGA